MPYRVAADLLQHVLPIDAGTSPETLRSHTLQVGKRLGDAAAEKPPIAATAITISLDSTFIRSRDDGERHLEVRVGNVETVDGGRQVFGALTRAETDITALIKRTKPEPRPCSGKSMAETYLLAVRCPVCRRRDSHSGFRMELENLADDAKGKGMSG